MSSRPQDGAGEVCAVLVRGDSGLGRRRWTGPVNDVGVDFPSLVPVLERMRNAFFGSQEGGGTQPWFELVVSHDEVGRTRDIVLDVPYCVTCGGCGGRGESWNQWCDACGSCGDTDVHHSVRVTLPRRVSDGARFLLRVVDTGRNLPEIPVRIRVVGRAS